MLFNIRFALRAADILQDELWHFSKRLYRYPESDTKWGRSFLLKPQKKKTDISGSEQKLKLISDPNINLNVTQHQASSLSHLHAPVIRRFHEGVF